MNETASAPEIMVGPRYRRIAFGDRGASCRLERSADCDLDSLLMIVPPQFDSYRGIRRPIVAHLTRASTACRMACPQATFPRQNVSQARPRFASQGSWNSSTGTQIRVPSQTRSIIREYSWCVSSCLWLLSASVTPDSFLQRADQMKPCNRHAVRRRALGQFENHSDKA